MFMKLMLNKSAEKDVWSDQEENSIKIMNFDKKISII